MVGKLDCTGLRSEWGVEKMETVSKIPKRNVGKKLLNIGLGMFFLDMTSKAQTAIGKVNKLRLYQKHRKIKQLKTEKATYRMGEKFCRPDIG